MQLWERELLAICKREGLEVYPAKADHHEQAYLFYRSDPLPDDVMKTIRQVVPEEIALGFKFQDKPSTIPALIATIITCGAMKPPRFNPEGKHLTIHLFGISEEQVDQARINTILEQDGFFQSWTVTVENQELYETNLISQRFAEEIRQNKKRDQVVSENDITDLRILMETAEDWDKFLEAL